MAFELAVPSSWNTVSTDFQWLASSHHEGVNLDITFPERPCLPALSYNTHHSYSLSPFLLAPDILLGICLLFCLLHCYLSTKTAETSFFWFTAENILATLIFVKCRNEWPFDRQGN